MEVQIVALKGSGGKYARADRLNTGPWADLKQGWRGLLFDRDVPDDDCKFELSKPDDKFKLVHVQTRGLFGMDATKHSGAINEQFYLKPDEDDRGAYEMPVVYEGALNGALQGVVEYNDDQGKYFSCAFGVEVL